MDGRLFSHSFRRAASALRRIIPALLVLGLFALGLPARAQSTGTAPDLVAENISFAPSAVTLGTIVTPGGKFGNPTTFNQDRITLQVTIRNKGTKASIPMLVRVWASPDATVDGTGNDVLVASFLAPGLAPGAIDDHTTARNNPVKIDPNFVGFYQSLYLQPGTYTLGVQVDANDENPGELDEHNVFTTAGTVTVNIQQPVNPVPQNPYYSLSGYIPGMGTDLASVSRDVEWTSSGFANRYNLYFGRIKDLEQRFQPGYLVDSQPGMTKCWIADFGNYVDQEPYGWIGGIGNINSITLDPTRVDLTMDLLVAQDYQMKLYLNKNQTQPYHPQFYAPKTVLETTTYPMALWAPYANYSSRLAGRKYSDGLISAAVPANVNFFWRDDPHQGSTRTDDYMDIVAANYFDPPQYRQDSKGNWFWSSSSQSHVYLAINETYYKNISAGIYEPPKPEFTTFTVTMLPNNRPDNPKVGFNPFGIKAVGAADLDNDGDVDICCGGDRYWPAKRNMMVFWQSDFRNFPTPDPIGPYPDDLTPAFEPSDGGNAANGMEDVNDLAFGDFDADGRMDIACVSFYGNCTWIMHNKTDVGGDVRTTRTLAFDLIGPMQRFDNNGTTVPLVGASTVCTSELYHDPRSNVHKPDIIAGGYIDGKAVVYENRSTYNGDTMNPWFIPHTLNNFITPDLLAQIGVSTADDMTNLEKVTVADMNGDNQPDIIVSWSTNDTIIWFENQMRENLGQYVFKAHLATTKANRVGWIAVGDLTNDLLPDIVSLSAYADTPCQWYRNDPAFTSKNRVATNLLQPKWQPPQQMDFNTMYAWQLESWAGDKYSVTSPVQTFHTQPTRFTLYPTLGSFSQIEPGAGINLMLNYRNDGPQLIGDTGVLVSVDPVLDRGFQSANYAAIPYGNPPTPLQMLDIGYYDFVRGFGVGQTGQISVNFPATRLPEGLYNFWVQALGDTPCVIDGVRNGILDGVPDGYDNVVPYRMWQVITNNTTIGGYYRYKGSFGDDCYLAKEKLAVCYKPGLPVNPLPKDGAVNIPTSSNLSWTTTSYTNGYDVYLAKSSTAMPTYTSVTISLAAPLATSIATGDIDNDSQTDLATSYYNGGRGRVAWFKNLGLGRAFRAYEIAADLNGPADVSIANLDSDTRPDILAASPFDGKILWYRNLGVGTGTIPLFGTASVISSQAVSVNTARPIDLNRDGKIDVVAAMSGPKRLCWYENTGTGWAEHPIDTVNGLPMYAIPADVNGDGLMDLVVASWSPYSIAWYENRGGLNPTFVRHLIDNTVQSPKWLAVGDINNDGGLDIVTVSNDTVAGSITWFESDRSFPPSFKPHTLASGVRGLHNLAVADYNHDARPDILTALDNGNQVLFYANNGGSPLTFTPFTINRQAAPVSALAAADLDGDTFQEILDGNTAGGMYWFDFVTNFQYLSPLAKLNNQTLWSSLGIANSRVTWSSLPSALEPSQGYKWQVAAKRQIPIYGGTYERVTSSTVWGFQTSQCDLAATKLDLSTRAVPQGDHFTVTVYEDNVGLSDAAPHVTEVWASPDPNFTRGSTDIYLGSINMPGIAAGGRATGKLDVNTAATGWQRNLTMAMGYYYIGYFVNTTGAENSESRQDNNFNYSSGRLQILHGNAAESWRGYR